MTYHPEEMLRQGEAAKRIGFVTMKELRERWPCGDPPSEKWIRERSRALRMGNLFGRTYIVREDFADHCPPQDRAISADKIRDAIRDTDPYTRVGFVYFLRCSKYVKVGFAMDVASRLRDLNSANPFGTVLLGTLPGSISGERAIHALLKDYRHKLEWFHLRPDLIKVIEEVCACP